MIQRITLSQVFIFTVAVAIAGCSSNNTKQPTKADEAPTIVSIHTADTVAQPTAWTEECIINYRTANKDRLTEVDGYPVTFFTDSATRNGRKYAMVQFGHTFEHRYITDQWIYIDSITKEIFELDLPNDSLIRWNSTPVTKGRLNAIPKNGKYMFEVAFAEWGGKSMGVRVVVLIRGKYIKVFYEGVGNLTAKKGELLDAGMIVKHKSGQWIIAKNASDANLDEVGGCTGGPAIIDFANRKFWMC